SVLPDRAASPEADAGRNTRYCQSSVPAHHEGVTMTSTTQPTTVSVEEISLATGTLALVTLAGADGRPATLGPRSMPALDETLADCATRVRAGEITAIAVTGAGQAFAAGADLRDVSAMAHDDDALAVAHAGHRIVGTLNAVPSFALVNGLALGGGLELALA